MGGGRCFLAEDWGDVVSKRGAPGQGGVFQLADGRWRASIDLGWVDGRRLRPTRTTHSEAAAKRALRELREMKRKGLTPSVQTVEDWLEYWLDEIAANRVRETTLPGYRSKVRLYLSPSLGRARLQELTPEQIEHTYRGMRERGLSETTIRQTHAILRRSLKVACDRGKIERNPADAVQLRPLKDNPHPRWSPDLCRRALDAAAPGRQRLRVLCGVMLGMRPGEILGLGWNDVHEDEALPYLLVSRGVRRLPGKGLVLTAPKSARSNRAIPLPPPVAEMFARWRAESGGQGLVFASPAAADRPVDPKTDWKEWREFTQEAGLPYVSPHGARGSAAVLLVDAGVPMVTVQAILGHQSITTTAKHYAIAASSMQRDALMLASARLGLDRDPELGVPGDLSHVNAPECHEHANIQSPQNRSTKTY